MNKKPRKLSTILTVYFVISIIFLSGAILFWTYYSATKAMQQELIKSFQQKYVTAQNIIEHEAELIETAIHGIQLNDRLLLKISNNQTPQAQKIFEEYADKLIRYKIDVLFISKADTPVWIDVSLPLPEVQPILENIAAQSRKFLTTAKIVHFKNNGTDLTGIFKSKKIILEDGRVLGIVVAGIILNDNLLLLNKIKHKTKSFEVILTVKEKVIASTTSKGFALWKDFTTHPPLYGDLHFEKYLSRFDSGSWISSHYQIELFETKTPVNIVFTVKNDVLVKVKKIYLKTLAIMVTLFVLTLFLMLFVIRRLIAPPVDRMLDYIEKVTLENNHDIKIEPGPIIELNIIGSAMEQMIESINQVQSKLQASEKKYKELADFLPQVVFEVDATGNIIYINQNAFELFGYSKVDFKEGFNVSQVLVPEERDRVAENIQKILNGAKLGGIEYTALKSDGTTFPAVIHSNLVIQNGKPIGLRGLLIDISNQKQMEADLKRRALAIDSSSDTVVITDINGDIIYVNPAFEKITGYSRKEAIGANPRILQSGNHDKSFYKELWENITSGKTWSGRFINKKKDGSQYIEDATISPVFSDKGTIINYVAVKRDVSEKLQLEKQLHQTLKMESIGTLAAGIAHDFNNILFPIMGHTEMMLQDIPEGSSIRNSLEKIYSGTLRAKDLVKQILAFSRQDSGDLKLIKIQHIVKEVLKFIRSTIPATIEIQQNIQSDCGVVKADPTKIHQIIMNLSTNAYHAMKETGGQLKVSLKEIQLEQPDVMKIDLMPGTYACLTISDTGKGINKELMQKIFDPFFTTKERGQGTGMGLSVVHGIVHGMGGTIQVYSEPEKGAEFHVYLPVETSSSESQKRDQIIESLQSGIESILLIDDEDEIVTMEKLMLERLGYKVTSCTNSIEALEIFRDEPDKFDLVITDMTMPNMPGDKLSAELIKIHPDIPILLCTGFSGAMSDEEVASLGVKGLLLKPVVMKELARKIRELLDKK